MSDESLDQRCAWVKLYHKSGALVTLPVPCSVANLDCYVAAYAAVSGAIEAGFTVNMPGLEAGEEKEQVGYVLRREKQNADHSVTPIIDLYSPNDAVKFKVFSVYLNRDEDVEAFEKASGLSLDQLRVFPGTAAPERGANRQSDSFICKVNTFAVILKPNPKWNPDEKDATKKKPRRLFVRWDGQAVASDSPEANGKVTGEKVNTTSTTSVDHKLVDEWKQFLRKEPNEVALTASLKAMNQIKCKYTWRAVWQEITEYAGYHGYDWDQENKKFVAPVDVKQDEDSIPF